MISPFSLPLLVVGFSAFAGAGLLGEPPFLGLPWDMSLGFVTELLNSVRSSQSFLSANCCYCLWQQVCEDRIPGRLVNLGVAGLN